MLPEPVAISFANTRSSSHRDRIGTLTQWRAWLDAWPGIRAAGHAVDANGLLALRAARDDVQLLLRPAAGAGRAEPGPTARLLERTNSASNLELLWRAGRPPILAVPSDVAPATLIAQHLTHATLDLLLTGPPLAVCQGQDCLKLFVASREDRRWCDSAICGNRARVRAHNRRRDAGQPMSLRQSGSSRLSGQRVP